MKIYINGKNVYDPKNDFVCWELDDLDKKNIGNAISKYPELKYFMQFPDKADCWVKSYTPDPADKRVIISGFPGVGKSSLKNPNYLDLDSSQFSRNNFPNNYLNNMDNFTCTIGVSCHVEVLRELTARVNRESDDRDLVIVYPKYELKEEYLQRYRDRGSPESFVKLMDEKWDSFSQDIRSHIGPNVYHIELEAGQYLSDVIKFEGHL